LPLPGTRRKQNPPKIKKEGAHIQPAAHWESKKEQGEISQGKRKEWQEKEGILTVKRRLDRTLAKTDISASIQKEEGKGNAE